MLKYLQKSNFVDRIAGFTRRIGRVFLLQWCFKHEALATDAQKPHKILKTVKSIHAARPILDQFDALYHLVDQTERRWSFTLITARFLIM